MSTFSEVVDTIVTRSGRPARRKDIESHVRATIRECQVEAVFARDLYEDTIVTDGTTPFIWERPVNLRIMKTVNFLNINTGEIIYPEYFPPGKIQKDIPFYYYGGPTYFAFSGLGDAGVNLNVAYYTYAPRFIYYAENSRPAFFDFDPDSETFNTWQYLSAGSYVSTLGSAALDEAARELVTNWLLFDWQHVIEEGGCAKIFKTVGDPRDRPAYALFKSFVGDLSRGERTETLGD